MDIKLKIKCSCYCSYVVSENISQEEVSCPNCGKIPSYSENLVKMLKIAREIRTLRKSKTDTIYLFMFFRLRNR